MFHILTRKAAIHSRDRWISTARLATPDWSQVWVIPIPPTHGACTLHKTCRKCRPLHLQSRSPVFDIPSLQERSQNDGQATIEASTTLQPDHQAADPSAKLRMKIPMVSYVSSICVLMLICSTGRRSLAQSRSNGAQRSSAHSQSDAYATQHSVA